MTKFIVAEITKNWERSQYFGDTNNLAHAGLLLSSQFERVIEHNRQRGYKLHSFQLHQVMTGPDTMTETIIAVFERTEGDEYLAAAVEQATKDEAPPAEKPNREPGPIAQAAAKLVSQLHEEPIPESVHRAWGHLAIELLDSNIGIPFDEISDLERFNRDIAAFRRTHRNHK